MYVVLEMIVFDYLLPSTIDQSNIFIIYTCQSYIYIHYLMDSLSHFLETFWKHTVRQLLGQIPTHLHPNVVLAAGEGSAMYIHDGETFVEDVEYLISKTPGLPHYDEVVEVACSIKRRFMLAAYANSDRTLALERVSPVSRKESYTMLLENMKSKDDLEKLLTNEWMMEMGVLPKFRGSMIWRNHSGIPKGWEGERVKKEVKELALGDVEEKYLF